MSDTFQRLVIRDAKRTEAEIQADVRQFILSAPFELEDGDLVDVILESPLGDRRRIDVEAGSTVIEVKRDLRKAKAKKEAEDQLAGYVDYRMTQTGQRYVGVLTDGTEWNCYDLVDGKLRFVSGVDFGEGVLDEQRLVVWLEGVLATTHGIAPTIRNIDERLGSESSAYKLDRATLANLYKHHSKNPTVQVKRKLWSRLLLSALGTQFDDDDELFIDHTLLVNTSEIIAHAVLGLDVPSLLPATLLGGGKFTEAGVFGVVESDFFDWIVEVDGGEAFIRTLAKRLMRFVWADVNQDILKILYENFIGTETRKKLGEYYTPDWLAEIIVAETVTSPLNTRVLDPSCGSGTFVFHAVRRYIAAGEAEGRPIGELLSGVTRHVVGMDLHPVAVTLARVTYLLAIGRDKLIDPLRGDIHIPVYLGDSFQWREQSKDLFSAGNLVIRTDEEDPSTDSDLVFPDALLDDAGKFDQMVNELADQSANRKPGSPPPSLKSLFARFTISKEFQATISDTFKTMCRLQDEGRDHIWGYYVRNLARPMWLSRVGNQVDMIVGNPPWLAFNHMTPEMQVKFKAMSESRDMWAGAQLAPHGDLSGLFVVRACQLYLRKGGRFAMVLPNAAIDREHYAGFRRGKYVEKGGFLTLDFGPSWDLRRIRPHFFPRAASVVFGTRAEDKEVDVDDASDPHISRMPDDIEVWTGQMKTANAPWSSALLWIERVEGKVRHSGQLTRSPYAVHFTQGAILSPQIAFIVKKKEMSPLGVSSGKVSIESQRSPYEKKPWKQLPPLSGVVEGEFLRPCFSGEGLYPYRMGKPRLSVIPDNGKHLLSPEAIDVKPGLRQWWSQASAIWEEHRASERLTLTEQLDFQSKLTKQLPLAKLRIVYNTSGMHICSSKLRDNEAIVNSDLYWAPMQSEREATFVTTILNAPVTTELARPFMSYGKDERHIHKHVWELPIPSFDVDDAVHARVIEIGELLEKLVASYSIDDSVHFSAGRRHIRKLIMDTSEGQELNDIVTEMIG